MAGTIVIERTERIDATIADLLPHVAEFRHWPKWSPWESLDPAMQTEYTGEPGAVGSTYSWSGNRKAGAGKMLITAVAEDSVDIDLNFTRPFASSSTLRFRLQSEGDATRITWQMVSPKTFMMHLFNIEKLVGKDFEKGLRDLKRVVEAA